MMHSTREIEGIIRQDLENWMRWGRSRDWMPASYGSILGKLYRARLADGASPDDELPPAPKSPVNERDAMNFERIVVSLPKQQRAAFVLHHLWRGAYHGRVINIKTCEDAARVLGVGKTKYHQIVHAAHRNLLEMFQRKAS